MEVGSILVLNASFEPLNIVNWKRAVVLLIKEKATVITKGVIKLKEFINVKYNRFLVTRKMIYERDGYKCLYCGSSSNLSVDHVIPKSRGGEDSWTNLVTACLSCNSKKGNKTPEEAGMILKVKPTKPRSKIDLQILRSGNSVWREFSYT